MCTNPPLPGGFVEMARARTNRVILVSPVIIPRARSADTHIDSVLVRLDHKTKHLRSLQAFLVHQPLANAEQLRERVLDDLIELLPLLAGLKPVHATNCQQALQTGVDGVRIVGTQQLQSQVQESRPLFGEVMLQNLLEEGNQLGADIGRRRGQGRDEPLTETRLLGWGGSGSAAGSLR